MMKGMKEWSRYCLRGMGIGVFSGVLLLMSACGGGGSSPGDGGGTPPLVTLSEIQAAIFTPKCGGCHSPQGEGVTLTQPTSAVPDGIPLDLSTQTASYNGLVLGLGGTGSNSVQSKCGVNADQHCGLRVVPGNPNDSYLMDKLEGTGRAFGTDLMPRLGCCLSQAEIDLIRSWITNGAKND